MKQPTKTDYLDWFKSNQVPNPVALTLTLKQKIETDHIKGKFDFYLDDKRASENVRYFLNRMNQSVYGNSYRRFGKRLSVIPIIEGNTYIRTHIHMILERPDRINMIEYQKLIRKCWQNTSFGHQNIMIKYIYDYEGWVKYLLKNKTKDKGLPSSIDWSNLVTH